MIVADFESATLEINELCGHVRHDRGGFGSPSFGRVGAPIGAEEVNPAREKEVGHRPIRRHNHQLSLGTIKAGGSSTKVFELCQKCVATDAFAKLSSASSTTSSLAIRAYHINRRVAG